jgi:hypothetical protein
MSLAFIMAEAGDRIGVPGSPDPVQVPTPGPLVTPEPSPGVIQPSANGLNVGFRSSFYGISPMPSPDYWYRVGADAQGKFDGSGIEGVWVIGCVQDDGACYLNFPSVAEYPDITFSEADENEQHLSYFDRKGIRIYLQVEPGDANVDDLIRLVLDRYSQHPCIVGFGIDAEWYRNPGDSSPDGKPVTDEEAARWYGIVRSYNESYRLFLKHWLVDHMPPAYRQGIYFIDDSMGFSSLDQMTADFALWGKSFPDNPVGFQIGYNFDPNDKDWWGKFSDPFSTLGHAIINRVPNAKGIYWVDFSIKDLYPI